MYIYVYSFSVSLVKKKQKNFYSLPNESLMDVFIEQLAHSLQHCESHPLRQLSVFLVIPVLI